MEILGLFLFNMNLNFNNGKYNFKFKHSDKSDSDFDYYEYLSNNITLILKINKADKSIQYWSGVNVRNFAFADRKNKNYISDPDYQIIVNYFTGQLQLINKDSLVLENVDSNDGQIL